MNKETRILHRKINRTSSIRFEASFRLEQHDQLSKWMIPILSAILIIIPLKQLANVESIPVSDMTNVIQVFVSIIILILSVLISSNDFSLRAFKQHKCAMRLNELAIFLETHKKPHKIKLDQINEKYANILHEYEAHKSIDYDRVAIKGGLRKYLNLGKDEPIEFKHRLLFSGQKLLITAGYISNFWLYIIVLTGTCFWTIYVIS